MSTRCDSIELIVSFLEKNIKRRKKKFRNRRKLLNLKEKRKEMLSMTLHDLNEMRENAKTKFKKRRKLLSLIDLRKTMWLMKTNLMFFVVDDDNEFFLLNESNDEKNERWHVMFNRKCIDVWWCDFAILSI